MDQFWAGPGVGWAAAAVAAGVLGPVAHRLSWRRRPPYWRPLGERLAPWGIEWGFRWLALGLVWLAACLSTASRPDDHGLVRGWTILVVAVVALPVCYGGAYAGHLVQQ
ncbi:MAG: hypothetical protein LBL55_00995, partial [Propionibacteriaceae bacterium]|nr:hypothetical protein [Propionibacteriaceae bacterium]